MTARRRPHAIVAMTAAMQASPLPWPRAHLEERWSRTTLTEAARLGLVVRMAPAQYAHRDHAGDLGCRIEAAARWMGPYGCISGLAALRLCGWQGVEPTRVDVILPRDVRLTGPPYVDTFRTDDAVVSAVVDGVRVASAEDATIHAWRRAAPPERIGLLLEVLRDGPVDAAVLLSRIDAQRRLPDRARLRGVVELAGTGVQSVLEYRAATEVFHGPEWADWERQGEVVVQGIALHPDRLHRASRVAVELDGARFHSDDARRRRDLERDALLAAAGYAVMHFTWEDIARRPQWCRARVREAMRSRGAAGPMRESP